MIGQHLSHFGILEQIGAGGMGVVYKAVDLRLKGVVALKVPLPEALSEPRWRERFDREAHLQRHLLVRSARGHRRDPG